MKANMSNSHCLRGIITEKLSMAASEILAAVERTLAVYEAEASGLRQELELERQKWQPELFQPRVKEEPSVEKSPSQLPLLTGTMWKPAD
ncbi:hypothetical protein ILYODFUR_028829 [Ilyodon furcidens]|uniref:Uncharacterized protein n=1 Tax=Ilyodon furcidens TaxID=33524 RepID=A0ABV0UC19_9TELE